jgi:hypothetical protein
VLGDARRATRDDEQSRAPAVQFAEFGEDLVVP